MEKEKKYDVVCQVTSDKDQEENYNDLPNTYYRDLCFVTKKGEKAKYECDTTKCDHPKIARVTFAVWGLVFNGCPNYQTNHLCHKDVSIIIEKKCAEKKDCEIEADESSFTDSNRIPENPTTDPKLNLCEEKKQDLKLTTIITCRCEKEEN